MAFWHFGVSFREHLAHCPSPVIVTSLSSAARLISDRPEQRTATASNESSFRIVILPPNEDYPGREAAGGHPTRHARACRRWVLEQVARPETTGLLQLLKGS